MYLLIFAKAWKENYSNDLMMMCLPFTSRNTMKSLPVSDLATRKESLHINPSGTLVINASLFPSALSEVTPVFAL